MTLPSYGQNIVRLTAVDLSDLAIAGEAAGDLIQFDGAQWNRLPVGNNNDVLIVSAGVPTWSPTLTNITLAGTPTAAAAIWTNLGSVTTIDINGGTLDGVTIGAAVPAAATVTTLTTTGAISAGGSLDMNSNTITEIGNAGSQLLDDAWTMVSANTQTLLVETTGQATQAILNVKVPADGGSQTGAAVVNFYQGSGTGAANNMRYQLAYAAGSDIYQLRSFDTDGSSTDGNVFTVGDGTNDVKFGGGISTDGQAAPTSGIQTSVLRAGVAGTSTGTIEVDGGTSGTVTLTVAAVAGTWTMTLPPDNGDAGEQLQTNGAGVTTWEAAGSLAAFKDIRGVLAPKDALDVILNTRVPTWNYRRETLDGGRSITTGDFRTLYAGVLAEDAPWAMHHSGRIFNPVNAFGYTVAAFHAVNTEQIKHEARLGAVEQALETVRAQVMALGVTPEA